MSILTLEGLVSATGNIQLLNSVKLPVNTKVYIIVPAYQEPIEEAIKLRQRATVYSPRLANPAQVNEFEMEVSEDSADV